MSRTSGLTRDGAVNPSRETKISGANGGRKTNKLPVQMTTGIDWQQYYLFDLYSPECAHKNIHTHIHTTIVDLPLEGCNIEGLTGQSQIAWLCAM